MKNSEYYEKELGYINDDCLRRIVAKTLDNSPECIVHIPASSSGRYHPSYSLGEGGLMRHVKAAVGIAHSLIATDIFKNFIYGNKEIPTCVVTACADCVYAALILHDCMKPDDTPKHSTRFDHPLLAAKLFVDTAKSYLKGDAVLEDVEVDMEYLEQVIPIIKSAIESHMGQFNTAPYAKGVVLPTPKTPIEQFVHLMDYLGSRKFLIFDFDVYNEVER